MSRVIYYVEDDDSIRELVVYALQTSGFQVMGFENAALFYRQMKVQLPDLILLDIMLPDEDGVSVLKHLRKERDTMLIPVIMMTAKSSEYDKVLGLDSGADDYITKPFGVMELISRVKAVIRRSSRTSENTGEAMSIGDLTLDEQKHEVYVKGEPVNLTFKEFELLSYLMKNRDFVLSRDKILNTIWNYEYEGESRTVDVHIGSLRQKLGSCGDMIKTVRGIGYKIGD
ncbi:MAG: response regulator transcription factor [Firmicutes bacterium]|nr:response regulator transcription factor [Lachnospiraceae bacterium]MDD6067037.1 response regulator transcription factor [Bacillota bacterium]